MSDNKRHLTDEMKAVIGELYEKEKKEMIDAGEWDPNNLAYSISRAYSRVLDGLLWAVQHDMEDKDEHTS